MYAWLMRACGALLEGQPKAELLWASVREVLNIFQADHCGCQIVTVPHDILSKAIKMVGTDLGALNATSRKLSSTVMTAAAGAFVSHPVAPGISLFAAGQGERGQPGPRALRLVRRCANPGDRVAQAIRGQRDACARTALPMRRPDRNGVGCRSTRSGG